jgi:hypothetical protein
VKWTHEDGAKKGSSILGYGGVFGDVFMKHVQASMIKKGVHLEGVKTGSSSRSSGMRKAKV